MPGRWPLSAPSRSHAALASYARYLGQGRGERRHRFTAPVHQRPPSSGRRSSPPPLSTAWPSPSLLARSWSRKASRVLRKSADVLKGAGAADDPVRIARWFEQAASAGGPHRRLQPRRLLSQGGLVLSETSNRRLARR